MRIKLIRDAKVNLPEGTVVEVTEVEAERLKAFSLGIEEPAKKKSRKEPKD